MTQTNAPAQIGLNQETTLLINQSREGACGVDLPEIPNFLLKINQQPRQSIGLPQVNEPQVVRHFVRLSNQNYSIDSGFYPLGSCTMKHNPRLNEKMARLPGFADIHPLQDESTVQWKKIYIELKTIVSGSTSADYFEHSFEAILGEGKTSTQINIDNIKVVYF